MTDESIRRQIALVSYGTKFLRNEIDLESWCRHGIFFGARLLFREPTNNALLADDFTLWLGILQRSGAVRLSLHLLSQFDIEPKHARPDCAYAVVAHYASYYQIWAVGEERAAWLDHSLIPSDGVYPPFPNAAGYGGELDSYWCVEQKQGSLEVPKTNWKELTATIAADLEVTIPSSHAPGGPVITAGPAQPEWAKMPLFPSSHLASPAHRLLAALYWEQAKFANDAHPKNEDSYYQHLDEAAAAKAVHWSDRLNGWLIAVQLRCANE